MWRLTFLHGIQCQTTFIWSIFSYNAYFWQCRTPNQSTFPLQYNIKFETNSQWRHNVPIVRVIFLFMSSERTWVFIPLGSLLHNNVSAHTATLLTRYYAKNQIFSLSHPSPYSLDLALANFFLFPKIKLKMKGTFFEDIPAIQGACATELKTISQTKFSRAFDELYERCHECICGERFYVEGWCE